MICNHKKKVIKINKTIDKSPIIWYNIDVNKKKRGN